MKRIAFDATPLVGDHMSGVGYCEAGLVEALTRLHPELQYRFEYFSLRTPEEKQKRLAPFRKANLPLKTAFCSPLLYRTCATVLPIPYAAFFGKWAEITHFFNYIVPPGVSGKTVVTVHDMVIHAFPETVRLRTREMLRLGLRQSMERADCIVTDSRFSQTEIAKYYPQYAEKVRVVPCGVDGKRFHPVTDAAELDRVRLTYGLEEPYFLYLGTLEPRKNLSRLIAAYAQICKSYDHPPKLVLAGGKGWMYDGIFETVTRLGLQEQVIVPEYIPSEDLAALYAGALAFVFPSLYEGFGMPPLEAMACGTPVLTSNAASLPEVTGDAAVLVNPYKTEAIAAGMDALLQSPALRARLAKRGLERAARFTWDAAAEQLLSVYRLLSEV